MRSEIIVKKLKSGDRRAFKLVCELFYKQMYQAAFFITNDAVVPSEDEQAAIHNIIFPKLEEGIVVPEDKQKL